MSRVFITGGLGFIGSHLAHFLTYHNHEALSYGTINLYQNPTATLHENISYRLTHLLNDTKIVRGSTLEPLFLQSAITHFSPTHVIHLAALPLASTALHHTDEAFKNILRGLFNVLEIVRDTPAYFTYISSSMVYGDFAKSPMPEYGPTNPKEIYGTLKLMGELLVKAYSQRFSIPYTIIRPSAVYGPTDINYRVLQIFIERAMQGQPITINSSNPLDFTYVEDTVKGISLATFSPTAIGKTYNITFGQAHTLQSAATVIRNHFPDLIINQGEEPAYLPRRGALDITRARDDLGYNPIYSLELGIGAYVSHMRLHNRSLQ